MREMCVASVFGKFRKTWFLVDFSIAQDRLNHFYQFLWMFVEASSSEVFEIFLKICF